MFDHDGCGVFRFVIGRIGHEQRMVPAFPGQVFVADHPGGAFCGGDVAHLACAAFSRHAHALGDDARSIARATAFVADGIHALAHGAQVVGVDVHRFACAAGLFDTVDGFHQPRLNRAAGGKTRGHHRKLQWRGEHIALTDRGVDRIPNQPVLAVGFRFPRPVRGQPLGNGRHGQIVAHAKAKALRHRRDLVDAHLDGKIIVVDVAGAFERGVEVDMPVACAFPAVKAAARDLHVAGAPDGFFGADQPFLKCGEGCDHLEG